MWLRDLINILYVNYFAEKGQRPNRAGGELISLSGEDDSSRSRVKSLAR